MAIDLTTIKRGQNLLKEPKELKKNSPEKTEKKKAGRKKIENPDLKLDEKVVTYVTKKEKERLDQLVAAKGLNIAQYIRMIILSNKE